MYVKTNSNNEVIEYPYRLEKLRQEHPNVSFPREWSNFDLSQFNVFPVANVARPTTSNSELIVVEGTPSLTNNQWTQTWTEEVPSSEVLQQYSDSLIALIKTTFASKVDQIAITAGLDEDDIELINGAGTFSGSVLSYMFANSNQTFRTNIAAARQNAKSLIQSVKASTTLGELRAIDIQLGWPV